MHGSHLVSHVKHSGLRNDETLHVIGVVTNPVRYQSRYRLARQWLKEMEATKHVKVYMVEAAYKDRHFEVTESIMPNHLQLHTDSEIWLKENLINLGVRYLLPKDWKYMAWVDCDVHFRDPNWALSTIHQLQHYNIVQPWSDAVDLNFHGEIHQHFKGFGGLHAKRKKKWHHKGMKSCGYEYAHTGYAWACTRYFYETVEKLLDFCIVGAGDHHMAWACLGMIEETIHQKIGSSYKKACREWQEKASYACAKLVGFTPGRIEHFHHGPKERRNYWGRWDILLSAGFDPVRDLSYDSQGLLKLRGDNKYQLEQDVMAYNRQRLEDSIEQY